VREFRLVEDEPLLYVERGGRGLVTLADSPARAGAGAATHGAGRDADPLRAAPQALADAVRSGRVPKLSLERIDGEAAIASSLVDVLAELGFQAAPVASR
jgi:ATP-dependent Lhr-like helicase